MPSSSPILPVTIPHSDSSKGVLAGCCAHALWGVAVLYWHMLADLPAVSILAHRMLWSCLFMVLVLLITRRMGEVAAAIRDRRTFFTLAFCACVLSVNWGLFLWAVNRGNVVETSLGYFITPLLNVLMGRVFLGERLSRPQALAIFMALCGVAWGVAAYGRIPWIAFALSLTFAVYGFLQKTVRVEAAPSLFLETVVLAPFAILWLLWAHPGEMGALAGHDSIRPLLLMGSCIFTALPLLLFSFAARNVSLATVGILQYLSPSINFLLAVFVMGEHIKPADKTTFPLIWGALLIYTWDALRSMRRLRAQAAKAASTPAEHPSALP